MKALIYTRFSPRPNAEECSSCEGQHTRCRDYCLKKGYYAYIAFHDKAVSGSDLIRPELTRALDALCHGDVFVVDRQDRLSRDMFVSLAIKREIASKGATIEYADGSPCGDDPESKLFQNIMAAFAAFEREKFAERTKRGMAKKKAEGVHFGAVPYGYNRIEGKLILDIYEQNAIRDMMDWHKSGKSSEAIAKHCNKHWGKSDDTSWTARTIRRIIAREKQKTLDT